MKDPTRTYPIRMSRKEWIIPIYWNHNCTTLSCSRSVCDKNNQIERIYPPVQYNEDIVNCICDLDAIVIPDTEFYMYLNFPLSSEIDIRIEYPSGNISKRMLLKMISNIYQDIYEEEEQTSTPQTYMVTHTCHCIEKDLSESVEEVREFKKLEECCICNDKYSMNNIPIKLKCDHVYHKKCIKKWSNTSLTCPICRESIIECNDCNGEQVQSFDIYCRVIPKEFRQYRNETDGIYGIYGFDIDELVIRSLIYNREEKRLFIHITVPIF